MKGTIEMEEETTPSLQKNPGHSKLALAVRARSNHEKANPTPGEEAMIAFFTSLVQAGELEMAKFPSTGNPVLKKRASKRKKPHPKNPAGSTPEPGLIHSRGPPIKNLLRIGMGAVVC
jgi:hypothetical protein